MMNVLKATLLGGVMALGTAAAQAAVFTVTTGGTVQGGLDLGLFGASESRDLTDLGLRYTMSMTVDTAGGSTFTDPVTFQVSGAAPSAVFVSITVDGTTVSGFSGSAAFGSLIQATLSIDGNPFDGIDSSAEGTAGGQFISAFHQVYSLIHTFVPAADPAQTISYTVDLANDIAFGHFLSSGVQGDAELFLQPEWITLKGVVAEVPEPETAALLGLGLVGLGALRRRAA